MTDRVLQAELAEYVQGKYAPSETLVETTFAYNKIPGMEELGELEPGFSESVIRMVSERFRSQTAFCARAGLSKQLLHHMKADPSYLPKKNNAFACVIALELSLSDAEALLRRGSYTLSRSSMTDIIVSFFLEKKIYDIQLINEALYEYGEELLGSLG